MKWAKISTEMLFDLTDREIAAVAKYLMLYALKERLPTPRELSKTLSRKQLEIVEKHFITISKYIKTDIKTTNYDRGRKAENCGNEQKIPTETPT